MKAEYINHYLSDRDVANFARQSFAQLAEKYTEAQNDSLVRFLARGMATGAWEKLIQNDLPSLYSKGTEERQALAVYLRNIPEHWVPFGHPQISLRMKAPVPIRVQCFKHKIGFVESEESRRYISSTPEIYYPAEWRASAASVKQGSAGTHPRSKEWAAEFKYVTDRSLQCYEHMIDDGICPEQARFVLPQGAQVNWVWTGSLYAYAQMYNKRADSHAQKEIQDLAAQVDQIIAPLYPVSWAALTKGQY